MKEPIYRQIENDLKNKIEKGNLKKGDMIPSENELKEMYNVSRMTVRQALNNLVNDGYLYRHKGKGTFVNNVKFEKKIHGLLGFTEDMERMNREVKNEILSIETIPATSEVAAKLFLDEGDSVIAVNRVRYADNIPVLYEELYVPQGIIKELTEDIMSGSFYKYIEQTLGLTINYSIQKIEALLATDNLANSLKIEEGAPILFITLNSFLDNGRPFEYVKSYYNADQYRFVQHAMR